jgi:hypothetical protein
MSPQRNGLCSAEADGSRRDQIRRLEDLRTKEKRNGLRRTRTEHRRIVVDTLSGRRKKFIQRQDNIQNAVGFGAALAAIVVGVIALVAIIILL